MEPTVQPKKESSSFDPFALAYPYLPYLLWIGLVVLVFTLWAGVKLALSPTMYQATTLLKLSDATKTVSSVVSASGASAGEAAEMMLQTYVEEARSFNVASRTAQVLDVSDVPSLRGLGKAQLADLLGDRIYVKNYKSTTLIQITATGENPKLAADLANLWARSFIDEDLNIVRSGAVAMHDFLEKQSVQISQQMQHSQELLKANSGGSGGKMLEQGLAAQLNALEQRIIQLRDEQATLESKYKPDHPLVKSHGAELNRAVDERNRALAHSGDASWLQIVHEIKALENTSDWLMQKEQEAMVSENMSVSNLVVVAPATQPYNPSFPQRRKTLVNAVLKGILLGLALIWAYLFLRRPVQREEDLMEATGAKFLGIIPDYHLEEFLAPPDSYPRGTIQRAFVKALFPLQAVYYDLERRWKLRLERSATDPAPALAIGTRYQGTYFEKAFGELRNRLVQDPAWHDPFCIAIFTPGYQEGRSTVNAGLAVALAQSGKKVLLIDANPGRPALASLFNVHATPDGGLSSLLNAHSKAHPKPVETAVPGLDVLPAQAEAFTQSLDWVGSPRLQAQMAAWKAAYDCIVLDPPPLNTLSGAQNLAEILDGALLMAASGRTRHSQLKVSLGLLKGSRVPLLGCLLNRADIRYYSQSHRFFYNYSGLGRRVKPAAKTRRAVKAKA